MRVAVAQVVQAMREGSLTARDRLPTLLARARPRGALGLSRRCSPATPAGGGALPSSTVSKGGAAARDAARARRGAGAAAREAGEGRAADALLPLPGEPPAPRGEGGRGKLEGVRAALKELGNSSAPTLREPRRRLRRPHAPAPPPLDWLKEWPTSSAGQEGRGEGAFVKRRAETLGPKKRDDPRASCCSRLPKHSGSKLTRARP